MRSSLIAAVCLVPGCGPALAQHGGQGVGSPAGIEATVQAHGSFQRMQHRKDFSPQVALKDAAAGTGVYGVGALADLAGAAQAALLATARVAKWRELAIRRAMKQTVPVLPAAH